MAAASRAARLSESCGSSSPRRDGEVGRYHGGTAAVGDDHESPPLGRVGRKQQLRDVNQLADRRHTQDPGRRASRVDGHRVADERAGVRARGADTRGGLSTSEQHHRLAGMRRSPRERPAVAEVLEVDGNQPRGLMLCERRNELCRLEVGLVADGDEAGDSEAGVLPQERELDREIPALRNNAELARDEVARREVELGGCVVQAHAVRPEQHRARRAHALDDGLLAPPSVLRGLAETGRDGNDCPCAGRERGVDGLLERGCGNCEHDELRPLGQGIERAKRRAPKHLAAAAVDEEDAPPPFSEQGAVGQPLAPFRGVVRGADDGHRARLEQRPQVASGHRVHLRTV
jgi:hypothetical protein